MTKLRFKGYVYRYFGVDLARKDLRNYLASADFQREIDRIENHSENDLSKKAVRSLLVGKWQANNGFTRPAIWWSRRFSHRWFSPLTDILASVHISFLALTWDMEALFAHRPKK